MSQEQQLSKNKLTCTVTGKSVSVAPKIFDQRVLKYGSDEALRLNYISAEARKLLCTGKTVNEIRTEFNVPETTPLPDVSFVVKYTKWAKYRNSNKITPTNEQT
jgi:hypothetical protein